MSISTLTELKTALANWLSRDDLTSRLEEFIALGEAKLNRNLRLLQMETTATVTISSAARTAALPTGFKDLISLIYTDIEEELNQVTPDKIDDNYTTTTGRPYYFAITDTFLFEMPADQNYSTQCRYRKKFDLINDSTNWLLTNYPDAYLFSAMAEAELYIMNDERAAVWLNRAMQVVAEANNVDSTIRSRAPLRMDEALVGYRRANIVTGL